MNDECRKIRLLYIISQRVRWLPFEWVASGLCRGRFDLSYMMMSRNPSPSIPHIRACGVPTRHLPYSGRHLLPVAVRAIARHCREQGIDIVHAHAMDACLAGLLGARLAGVQVRIHTRHHAGPYPASHRPVWYEALDRWNNTISTGVIAPSELTRRVLIERDGVSSKKVTVINHGFDLGVFSDVSPDAVSRIRRKYGLEDDGPVVGVVARYERIKGVEHIIEAFRNLLGSHPKARLVLANARGRYARRIKALLQTIPSSRYVEIPFEEEMAPLYKIFDLFVHAPLRPHLESFGQVYVEAMAAGVPCVCAAAGIAVEFIRDGEHALLVKPNDPTQIHHGITRLLADPALRERLTINARRAVEQRFGLEMMLRALEEYYVRSFEARTGK
jgi:glycosyltransferase involved in cell wall biosynthesis